MTGRGLLLDELRFISENCIKMLHMARPDMVEWRPAGNMRSLHELANHLVQIPKIDLHILRGASEQDIQALETELGRDNPRDWGEVLRAGREELISFMDGLTLDQYENGSGTAFYGRTQTHARWLLEVVTHLYHHRSQLFMYLKLNGVPVNTQTLYS